MSAVPVHSPMVSTFFQPKDVSLSSMRSLSMRTTPLKLSKLPLVATPLAMVALLRPVVLGS